MQIDMQDSSKKSSKNEVLFSWKSSKRSIELWILISFSLELVVSFWICLFSTCHTFTPQEAVLRSWLMDEVVPPSSVSGWSMQWQSKETLWQKETLCKSLGHIMLHRALYCFVVCSCLTMDRVVHCAKERLDRHWTNWIKDSSLGSCYMGRRVERWRMSEVKRRKLSWRKSGRASVCHILQVGKPASIWQWEGL